MSAPGPESIPTSADPRSHRATKKRALTPLSSQAASVDALFARPDQDIRIPSTSVSRLGAPPEIVTHVQGSSSGAGSGEFHVYKAARRREYERLREMDDQVRREQDQIDFDKEKADRIRKDEERTKKNRERRDKMKARKAKKGKGGPPTSNATKAQNGNGVTERKDDDDERPHESKQDDANEPEGSSGKSAEPVGLVIHDDD